MKMRSAAGTKGRKRRFSYKACHLISPPWTNRAASMVFRSLSSPGFDSTGKQFDLFTSAISRTKPERTFPGPTSTSKSQFCVSVLTREMKSTCEITWFAKCSCSFRPCAGFWPSTLENRDTSVSLSVSGTTSYLLRRSAAAETI